MLVRIDQYRKEHVSDFIKQLNELADNASAVTSESDISFDEIESND